MTEAIPSRSESAGRMTIFSLAVVSAAASLVALLLTAIGTAFVIMAPSVMAQSIAVAIWFPVMTVFSFLNLRGSLRTLRDPTWVRFHWVAIRTVIAGVTFYLLILGGQS